MKKHNSVICDNMDKTIDHYVKWSKPGTERQVPHFELICGIWNSWLHDTWEYHSCIQRLKEQQEEMGRMFLDKKF